MHITSKFDDGLQESGLYESIDPIPAPKKGEDCRKIYMNSFSNPNLLKTPQASGEFTLSLLQSNSKKQSMLREQLQHGKGNGNEMTTNIIYDTPVDATRKKPGAFVGLPLPCGDYEVPCDTKLSRRINPGELEARMQEVAVDEDDYTVMDAIWNPTQ